MCGPQNQQRLFPYTALTDWFFIYNEVYVWTSKSTAIISLYSINWLFLQPRRSVFTGSKTCALDCAATGTGWVTLLKTKINLNYM